MNTPTKPHLRPLPIPRTQIPWKPRPRRMPPHEAAHRRLLQPPLAADPGNATQFLRALVFRFSGLARIRLVNTSYGENKRSLSERRGERWRRPTSARIRKRVSPAAIRSTEKLGSPYMSERDTSLDK